MPRLSGLRAGFAAIVASLSMTAMGNQTSPSFSGRVQKVGGNGLSHATVRIEGAGSTETSDSGEFTFPLSGNLKVGYPALFHVTNWIVLKPCELKNGRTYLRDPAAEPIEIFVLRPGDPRLRSASATESIIGCMIEEVVSRLGPKARPAIDPRTSLSEQDDITVELQTD